MSDKTHVLDKTPMEGFKQSNAKIWALASSTRSVLIPGSIGTYHWSDTDVLQ